MHTLDVEVMSEYVKRKCQSHEPRVKRRRIGGDPRLCLFLPFQKTLFDTSVTRSWMSRVECNSHIPS